VVGSNVGSSLPLYWDSPEAAKLFGFSYKNGDEVYMGLQQIVESLLYTQQSHDGYKRVVAHVECKPLTQKQIFHIQIQCLYLRTAYSIALKKMGINSNTWIGTCCKEAVEQLSSLGFNLSRQRSAATAAAAAATATTASPSPYVAQGIYFTPNHPAMR